MLEVQLQVSSAYARLKVDNLPPRLSPPSPYLSKGAMFVLEVHVPLMRRFQDPRSLTSACPFALERCPPNRTDRGKRESPILPNLPRTPGTYFSVPCPLEVWQYLQMLATQTRARFLFITQGAHRAVSKHAPYSL